MLAETETKTPLGIVTTTDALSDDSPERDGDDSSTKSNKVPWTMKVLAVMLVTFIGFGSHWSGGVTGAMKSTLKKELNITNTQYSVLTSSKDFMVTALMLITGSVTDRIGGAGAMVWGNVIYSLGSILVAAACQVRSYKFMIGGTVIQTLGDISTQVAQYKIFTSWFAPSNGFASTLGFELGIGKIGAFVGQATANIIADKLGDFAWVYWMAVIMNIFTNFMTIIFYFFNKWSEKRYGNLTDPATGEKLTEKNKKFEIKKTLELPWPFWFVILFTTFQTSTAIIFSANATEMAQQRFNISAVTAGWYTAMSNNLGFFLVPLLGVFLDMYGNRFSVMVVCGAGTFTAMVLAAWGPDISGTAASFGVYAFAYSLGPTVIVDCIRTSLWYQEVFGTAYSIKITINNCMNIFVAITTGIIQDQDDGDYDRVVIVYVFLAGASLLVALVIFGLSFIKPELNRFQWTRKQRLARGDVIRKLKEAFEADVRGKRNRKISLICFTALLFMIFGSWAAYFWAISIGGKYL
ncbi:unnamed protein product [Discula destructiva]